MKKFDEWLKERESIEEGFMRNLALGGAMLGAGMGIGCSDGSCKTGNSAKSITSSSVTSDDAADYFANPTKGNSAKSIPSSSVTSDDATDYLKNPSNYHHNDEIGRYTPEKDSSGKYIYKTKNGNYVRTKNVLGQDKFKRIK